MTRKIGLIGAGFMGYGIAMNLIKNKFNSKAEQNIINMSKIKLKRKILGD